MSSEICTYIHYSIKADNIKANSTKQDGHCYNQQDLTQNTKQRSQYCCKDFDIKITGSYVNTPCLKKQAKLFLL